MLIGGFGVGAGVVACWLGEAMVPQLRYDVAKTLGKAAAGLLGAVVVAVGEEALFRGWVLRGLRSEMSGIAAILLSSVIFGVFHMEPARIAFTAALGAGGIVGGGAAFLFTLPLDGLPPPSPAREADVTGAAT